MRTDVLSIAAILTVAPTLALAQATATDSASSEPRGTLSIIVENDKFNAIDSDKQTDRNFTSGIRFNWISEPRATPEWGLKLAGWVPMFPDGGTTRVGYAFGQNMYTPENTQRRDHIVGDRPYSGWTYLGAAITSSRGYGDSAQLDTLEVNLGIVGPRRATPQRRSASITG